MDSFFINVLINLWELDVLVALLSREGQKVVGFHQKYLNLFSEDEPKVL